MAVVMVVLLFVACLRMMWEGVVRRVDVVAEVVLYKFGIRFQCMTVADFPERKVRD